MTFLTPATSKYGVLGFQRGLLDQLRVRNLEKIRLNSIAPNWTRTNLHDEDWLESIGVRQQDPDSVARGVALLATDTTRHGEVLYIEGGLCLEVEKEILAANERITDTTPDGDGHAHDHEIFERIFEHHHRAQA